MRFFERNRAACGPQGLLCEEYDIQQRRRPSPPQGALGGRQHTILGQRAIPAVLDRYLAKTGFGSQQTGQPADADRSNNLWEPPGGAEGTDYGVHGVFDDRPWSAHHNGGWQNTPTRGHGPPPRR